MLFSRRNLLLGSASLPFATAVAQPKEGAFRAAEAQLAALEQKNGGRLGVAVLEPATGARLSHRSRERFAMCSTFKFLAASAVAKAIDDGKAKPTQEIPYGPGDLLGYAPETKKHVAEGQMSLSDLCAAAIEWSDNTAANLMLRQIGGPPGLTRYIRTLGDDETRLDRTEPTLNTAIPGDVRDTTTPEAMLHDMNAILLGDALSPASRRQIESWMVNCKTGFRRLRAGLPPDWRVADKTGGGDYATANTIALLRPPQRSPLIATVYYTGSSTSPEGRDAVHAEVARIIARTF